MNKVRLFIVILRQHHVQDHILQSLDFLHTILKGEKE